MFIKFDFNVVVVTRIGSVPIRVLHSTPQPDFDPDKALLLHAPTTLLL